MAMDALTSYRTLRKEGRLPEALRLLAAAIPRFDAAAIAQAGKLLQKDLAATDAQPLRVLVVGQCTTTYLLPALTAWTWAEGIALELHEGGYDQVLQDLLSLPDAPDIVVLLPWHQRLLAADARGAAERVEDEMVFLQQAWSRVERLQAKLVQVGYDWTHAGSLGFSLSARRGGEVALVQQINASLRAALPGGTAFIDLESISAWAGKSRFYDERNYHWLKQPFSPEGVSLLARHIAVSLRSLTRGRRKVLVLDLDNTLWGGVVGEAGPHGIAVGSTSAEGEAFLAFQKHVRRLKESGVLLAACSKNNEADAREPFETNAEMVLRLDDFSAFHASWDTKPARIRRIAGELNLGTDSFVFFDDNPAEREHVRAELPEVLVVEVPEEPAHFVRALQESLAFEAVDLTTADSERAAQYQAESSRKQAASAAASTEDYLASLMMHAIAQPVAEANLDRVVDLITKTNQFNLTTRRHSRAAVEQMAANARGVCFAVTLTDKFGDYGLVSVLLAMPETERRLRIDTWLMSCRAMGRTLERWVMDHLAAAARGLGFSEITGEYLPTAKNAPVKDMLPGFGFAPEGGAGGLLRLDLEVFSPLKTYVSGI